MNRQTRADCLLESLGQKPDRDPREVRERLALKPGDTLRYRVTDQGMLLDKAPPNEADDPFVAFSEWSSEADQKAMAVFDSSLRCTDRTFRVHSTSLSFHSHAHHLAEKRRPALVISNRKLATYGLIWVAMITSADNEPGQAMSRSPI